MKVVGLNIMAGRVAATLVDKRLGRTDLLDSFAVPFASDDELRAVLRERSRGWVGARIVSAVPGHMFSQRTLRLPFWDRKRLEKALPFELEDAVPFPMDSVILDHLVLQEGKLPSGNAERQDARVLCMMAHKAALRAHLELLSSAGVDPHAVAPSSAGLYAVAKMMKTEGSALLVCGNDLCLVKDGAVQAVRSFSGSSAAGGLRHVLQAIETEQVGRVGKILLLSPDESVRRAAAELDVPVEDVAPELGGKSAADPVSLGLAVSGEPNFRQGELAYRLADRGARRMRNAVIVAGVVSAVLFGVNLGVKFAIVQSGYGKLDKQIREVYHRTFPEAKTVLDPARQMRESLLDAKKRLGSLGTGTSVLDVMKAVTDGIPKEVRVAFSEFVLEGDRLKLQGEASSFESVDKIKAELQKAPVFSEVVVQDTRMGVENKVKFRMEIKLKSAQ